MLYWTMGNEPSWLCDITGLGRMKDGVGEVHGVVCEGGETENYCYLLTVLRQNVV